MFRTRSSAQRGRGSAIVKLVGSLVAVGAIGVAAGYLSQEGRPSNSHDPVAHPHTPTHAHQAAIERSADLWRHGFSLAPADVDDMIEAPALAVDGPQVYLAWASETNDDERTVFLARSRDGGRTFEKPRAVVTTGIHAAVSQMRGRTIERRLRTLPHLAAQAGMLYLAWVDGGETVDTVVMRLAESKDGGESFSAPITVHQSLAARPTFTSLSAADDGTLVCSWLDNRNGVQQPFASLRRSGETAFKTEQLVHAGPDNAGICPCCPTAAIVTASGTTLVAYRGNEDGYRDMWIGRWDAGEATFDDPIPVVSPTWQFTGCPHDGPTLVESGKSLHVAWMDAHTGGERVYYARSGVEQIDFRATAFQDGEASQAHPHLVASGPEVYLAWDESASEVKQTAEEHSPDHSAAASHKHHHTPDSGGRMIIYRRSHDGGESFSKPVSIAPRNGAFQTRPKLAMANDGAVYAAWMELDDSGKSVVVARISEGFGDEQR